MMSPRQLFRPVLLLAAVALLLPLSSSIFVQQVQGIQSECSPGSTIVHVVAEGENLFRLALRYQTTVAAIAAANGISDPTRIFVGQRLLIPCGSSGGGVAPVTGSQPQTDANCAGFRLTSPLDGLNFGPQTFYWDPAAGATSYRLNIYRERDRGFTNGPLLAYYFTDATHTSLSVNAGFPLGREGIWFSWEVQAYSGGTLLCTTIRWSIWRELALPQAAPIPTVGPTPGPTCGDDICDEAAEDCELCPEDCGPCDPGPDFALRPG